MYLVNGSPINGNKESTAPPKKENHQVYVYQLKEPDSFAGGNIQSQQVQ
jgi:hypothetical protein